jgi:hypothetical protein
MIIAFQYESKAGTTTNAYATKTFTFSSRFLEITIIDQAATLRFMLPNGTYGDEVTYDPDYQSFPYTVPFQTLGFMIKSANPGVPAGYQLVNWH